MTLVSLSPESSPKSYGSKPNDKFRWPPSHESRLAVAAPALSLDAAIPQTLKNIKKGGVAHINPQPEINQRVRSN